MKIYQKLLLASLVVFAVAMGCKKKDETQSIAPANAGERGTACQSKNDCGADLSCLVDPATGIRRCQPPNFAADATMKECYQRDCETQDDCCGDRVTEAPTKCREREIICELSQLPGCQTFGESCISNTDCTGGALCAGNRYCENLGYSCTSDAQCDNFCDLGMGGAGTLGSCAVTGNTCYDDTYCYSPGDTCGSGDCSCDNPDYNPFDPICTDPDCDNVCTLVCSDSQQCVEDTSCESNADCAAGIRNICTNAGECVECEADSDCDDPTDTSDDEDECNEAGTCFAPCRGDSECGFFEACQEDGTCKYVGCRSTQECILAGGGAGGEDRRLLTCEQDESGIGMCRIECEIDAQCPQTSVCESGTCKDLGCSTDTDCYALLGLHDWMRTEYTPWTPKAYCLNPADAVAED